MEIRFTKHAEEKFAVLARHGIKIPRATVVGLLTHPEHLDEETRKPLLVAQGSLDASRVLRVVYKVERGMMIVITFYPGRKSQYER